MKGDNTFIQNQYGQDQLPPQQQGFNDSNRGFGHHHQQQPQAYGAVGNQGGHYPQQQAGGQPIYVVDEQRRGGDNFVMDILLYVVAFFIPPASVVVKRGCGGQFWLNVILTILGFLPGLIHAFYIIAVTPGTYQKAPRRR